MKIFTISVLLCLFATINLSAQWVRQTTPGTISFLTSVNFTSQNSGITTGWGLDTLTTCRAFYTTNGGTTWIPASVPDSSRAIVSTEVISSQIIYGTGGMNIFTVNFSNIHSNKQLIQNISPANKTGVPAITDGGIEFSRGTFFKSTDGGRSWNQYGTVPQDCYYITYCDFINANTGMAIASIGVLKGNTVADIIKTTNGGLTWNRTINTTAAIDFKSINFVNDNIAFATGYEYAGKTEHGIVMKTTNGGINWTTIINDSNRYNKIYFTNSNTGFIAGNNHSSGIIMKTTNQGNSWRTVCAIDSLIMEGINFNGESGTGLAYGEKFYTGDNYQPFALRTNNYGETWTVQTILDNYPTISLMASAILDKYNYYLAGGTFQEGRIYNTKNGGSTSVKNINTTASEFLLTQNYPNPFNPITSIRFNIPGRNQVTLKVYNGVGKEIIELINEVKSSGTYDVEFNAAGLSSGVYYYRLISGDYTETKKMVLLK